MFYEPLVGGEFGHTVFTTFRRTVFTTEEEASDFVAETIKKTQ